MKSIRFIAAFIFTIMVTGVCYSQNQGEQKQKSPEEMAIDEANKLEIELKLSPSQVFYVDSILQHNYARLFADFEDMKSSGMQDSRNYQKVQEKWMNKNLAAFKNVLNEQQYIGYLKLIGKGKEYKKGKDGLYYKKEPKKKERDTK